MEENFSDLIEKYWDDDIVNKKISDDYKEEDIEAYDSRKDSPFTAKDEIYIDDFVNKFLGIKGDYTKFRHFELKNLNCPYVIGVANSYADNNPTFVTDKKYLLIVIDRNGNRGTYINPIIAHEYFDYDYKEAKHILKQRHIGFEHIEEFFENFIRVKAEYDAYLEFFNIIRENKKITKFKKINEYEKELGDDSSDKYKRR